MALLRGRNYKGVPFGAAWVEVEKVGVSLVLCWRSPESLWYGSWSVGLQIFMATEHKRETKVQVHLYFRFHVDLLVKPGVKLAYCSDLLDFFYKFKYIGAWLLWI